MSALMLAICVIGVSIVLGFSNGRDLVPVLAWIAPGLALALWRSLPLPKALIAIAVAGLIAGALQWRGVVPLTPVLSIAAASALGIVLMLPHLLDRLLHNRLPALLTLFLFPAAQVSLEYSLNLILPYATFGAYAYTQATVPIAIQTASLGGLWLVSFIIAMAAPAIAHILTKRDLHALKLSGVSAVVIAVAFGYGAVRLASADLSGAKTVKVAGIASKPSDLTALIEATKGCGGDNCLQAKRDSVSQIEALFQRSEAAIDDGAQVVVWSEAAAPVFADEEANLLNRLTALARDKQVWLVPALFVIEPGRQISPNKVMLINPQGQIVSQHLKSKPVPGELSVNGPDKLTISPTPFGLVSMAICYDFDFPALARQATDAAIVFVPGSDWADIDPLHPRMVALRAVENGFAVIRPSRESVSVAYDQYGRLLAQAQWKGQPKPTVVAKVPQLSVATLYARIGDGVAWLCVTLLGVLCLLAMSQKGPKRPST